MLAIIKRLIPKKIFTALQPAYHFIFNYLAACCYRFPSRKMIIIGITGTTGKTSTVYLTAAALRAAGYKVGYTSTAQFSDGEKEWLNDKKMTMVGRFFTQRLLRRMLLNGCQYAIVETTSEGIKQFRHRFINYDILLFTGLYPEHIESHGSFEKYKLAKGALFAHLKTGRTKYVNEKKIVERPKTALRKLDFSRVKKTIIVNGDDDQAAYFLNFWSEQKLVYSQKDWGSKEAAALRFGLNTSGKDWEILEYTMAESSLVGTKFIFKGQPITLQLLGSYNAINAAAAATVALSQDLSLEKVRSGLEGVSGLAGKLEKIVAGQDFTVLVDYAFEPRALTKVYETIALFNPRRVIHVLGSTGGGRDAARRPILGKIAGENAVGVIVTNEDPYDEDPQTIIDEVALGAISAGKVEGEDLLKILDRRQAIAQALSLAEAGDLVLITGKGAEQWICVQNSQKIPWDDRVIVREELAKIMALK